MVKTATNQNGESQNGDIKTATGYGEHDRNGDKDVWSKRRQRTAKCLQEIHALVNSATRFWLIGQHTCELWSLQESYQLTVVHKLPLHFIWVDCCAETSTLQRNTETTTTSSHGRNEWKYTSYV